MENNCPICGKTRQYKSKSGFYRANKNNLPCKSCSNSIQLGGPGNLYREGNFKICTICNTKKSLNDFFRYPSKHYYSFCKQCSREKSKRYHKTTYRYAKYGITKEQYDELFESQKGKCPICISDLKEEIHIDHDHSNGKVRGILCGKCNKGLGQFNDNIESLTNAIKYLKK